MKRLFFVVIGLLLFLSFLPVAKSQDQPEFRFHLPCDQVIRMGVDKYFTRYTAATHDQSTAGCVEAYESYAHCRRSVNDTQAHSLSPIHRAQLACVRSDLNVLAGACYDYIYLSAGGGTMWAQIEADDHAGREDFLSALIADLHRPAQLSRATRRQTSAFLRTAQRSLGVLRTPDVEGGSTIEASYTTQYRDKTYPAARVAFARLQALAASLPDVAAHRLAHELQQELSKPAQNVN